MNIVITAQLNLSPGYMSDMLRALTGHNTQQLIHYKLVEKAKDILATTDLSAAEIAYQLGFEHPQSFSRLFKSKTEQSPLNFRTSLIHNIKLNFMVPDCPWLQAPDWRQWNSLSLRSSIS